MTEKWKELLKAPQGQRKVFIGSAGDCAGTALRQWNRRQQE